MEFAVALFGALVNNAVPKLLALAENRRGKDSLRKNARNIYDSLTLIKAAIEGINISLVGSYASRLQDVGIEGLCRLAAEIEDCIDSFEAGKMKPKKFCQEIQVLEDRREKQQKNITDFANLVKTLSAQPASSSGPAAQQLPPAVAVPQQLQNFLGSNNGSMISNLNCLRYFCMFPYHHHVQRNPLIRRLLAEGLVTAGKKCKGSLKDVAALYLQDLVSNEIILPIQQSNNGMVKTCKTASGILEFISEESVSTDFIWLCDHSHREEQPEYVRRLSVRPGSATVPASKRKLNVPEKLCYVRTLAVFPAKDPVNYESVLDFTKYEVLRLLDLKECAEEVGELDGIWNLLMLKYLSLGDSIVQVPRRVENLRMLMTLDLGRNVEVKVFSEILLLPNLKHLLGKLKLRTFDMWWVEKNLQKFLSNGSSRLETLSGFVTGKKQGFAMLLSHMKNLRKVKIWCNSPANKPNWKKIKEGIEMFISEQDDRSLCIHFLECYGKLVESLEVPNASIAGRGQAASPVVGSLSSLKLCGQLQNFPKFVGLMTKIKEVCLSWTTLTGDPIILGLSGLKQLVYLKLEEKKLALDIKISHFEALKRICLVGQNSLDIKIHAGALELLVSLHLICKTLGALPGSPCVVVIDRMLELKEIVLHSENTAMRGEMESAAAAHLKRPVVSSDPST